MLVLSEVDRGRSEQRLEVNLAINKGVRVHIGETYQAES